MQKCKKPIATVRMNKKKKMSKLNLQPIILCDTREQLPLPISAYPVERATLRTGDYSILGFERRFVVERKSLSDLIGSLTHDRERFFVELDRMAHVQTAILLIEGDRDQIEMHSYRSQATPQSLLASLDAIFVRTPVKIEWAGTAENAARRLETFVRLWVHGIEKDFKALTR